METLKEVNEIVNKILQDLGLSTLPRVTPPVVTPFTTSESIFFGLPVFDLGSENPFKNFYISHRVIIQNGEEWWEIRTGIVELIAYFPAIKTEINGVSIELPDEFIPFALGRFVLPTAYEYVQRRVNERRQSFQILSNAVETGVVIVRKRDILFLNDVYAGKLPILVLDSSGTISERLSDRELMKLHAELRKQLIICYERLNVVELERQRATLYYHTSRIEVGRYSTLLEELVTRLLMLEGSLKSLQVEVDRLRLASQQLETMTRLDRSFIGTLRGYVTNLHELLRKIVEEYGKTMEELRKIVPTIPTPIEKKPEEKKVEVVEVKQSSSGNEGGDENRLNKLKNFVKNVWNKVR